MTHHTDGMLEQGSISVCVSVCVSVCMHACVCGAVCLVQGSPTVFLESYPPLGFRWSENLQDGSSPVTGLE
jgi:hypothetical protein